MKHFIYRAAYFLMSSALLVTSAPVLVHAEEADGNVEAAAQEAESIAEAGEAVVLTEEPTSAAAEEADQASQDMIPESSPDDLTSAETEAETDYTVPGDLIAAGETEIVEEAQDEEADEPAEESEEAAEEEAHAEQEVPAISYENLIYNAGNLDGCDMSAVNGSPFSEVASYALSAYVSAWNGSGYSEEQALSEEARKYISDLKQNYQASHTNEECEVSVGSMTACFRVKRIAEQDSSIEIHVAQETTITLVGVYEEWYVSEAAAFALIVDKATCKIVSISQMNPDPVARALSTPSAQPVPALTGDYFTDVAAIAKSQVEVHESGSSNDNPYAKELGRNGYSVYNGYPWCHWFCDWCFWKAGVPDFPTAGGTSGMVSWFKSRGRYYTVPSGRSADNIKPGSWAAIDNTPSHEGPDHSGIVVAVDNSSIYVVEGNYSDRVSLNRYSKSNYALNGSGSVRIVGIGEIVEDVQPSSVLLNTYDITLVLPTEPTTLLLTSVSPANATNKSVSWTSSNPAVATVAPTGIVTAVSAGTTNIVARTANGVTSRACVVTVEQKVTSISAANVNVKIGTTKSAGASVVPASATNKKLQYSVADSGIATVDQNGMITGKKFGSTTLTVKAADGSGAVKTVKVNVGLYSDVLNPDSYYYSAINDLSQRKIMNGYGNNDRFGVGDSISRCDFLGVLYKAYGQPKSNAAIPFTDCNPSSYYAPALRWGIEKSVMETGTKKFNPTAGIKRADACVFIWRAAGRPKVSNVKNPFSDVTTSMSQYQAIMYCVNKGIIHGTSGKFNPNDTLKREDAACMISNLLKVMGK